MTKLGASLSGSVKRLMTDGFRYPLQRDTPSDEWEPLGSMAYRLKVALFLYLANGMVVALASLLE